MFEFLEEKSTCIHSRKILTLIDNNQASALAEHLAKYPSCRESYARIKAILQQIDQKIPLIEITPSERRESQQYLEKLLKTSQKKKGLLRYLPW